MAGLLKEIWISQLLKNFYPDTSFLNFYTDLSVLSDNNKINLASAGVDPNVLINNTTYPITIADNDLDPISITLDKFETENTLIKRYEDVQYSFDQMEGVVYGHRQSLRSKTGQKAAHATAPASHTANTPVISTTGDTVGGKKMLSVDDILNLKQAYDDLDYPTDERYLVLCSQHLKDLIKIDLKAFKNITDFVNGVPQRFAGFNMLSFSKCPIYNTTTMAKKAFGAAASGTDGVSSFSFYKSEVMKADGDTFMYSRVNDPELRGTIVGFDKRFIALPFRNKGVGSIVTVPA
jgi:hypothetical protein